MTADIADRAIQRATRYRAKRLHAVVETRASNGARPRFEAQRPAPPAPRLYHHHLTRSCAQIYNHKVMRSPSQIDSVFAALADPIRRHMLTQLANGERTAGELGAPFRVSQPAASKHIRTLERAGLLARTVDGRTHRLSLVPKPLHQAEAWLSRHRHFWEGSLDALGPTLTQMVRGKNA